MPEQESTLNSIKCTACGLANFSTSVACRRCEAPLAADDSVVPPARHEVTTHERQILLHEAYHLFGDDEEFALRRVWLVKDRRGWTSLRYGHTRVWKNTREWTVAAVPSMFRCGEDGRSDCFE